MSHRSIVRDGFAHAEETRRVARLSRPAAPIVRRLSHAGRCAAPTLRDRAARGARPRCFPRPSPCSVWMMSRHRSDANLRLDVAMPPRPHSRRGRLFPFFHGSTA
ncbi:hypothetical protein E2P84_03225 [Burkholderia cepacia]|uniref:Uncharacterized protein n=1 Tax=Burkholderia cepacia TaxID=292 RepID=A0AAX2RWW4_BURCE|nr:hypothetical protein E2P84_03225 [Burkholderia cepacia]TET02636.1 hypothetical protein E3D36_12345 [Burkholderia cepacia]TEU40564.1 hypothetical protein E3D38_34420 [Burkholderia cepacia]TEU45291.1 hypothetical protein E3D39_09845 [Burkholderia cepacia]TEU52248.1 hypothetical protein E3D37_06210 [Burkholderia cepacia]